MLPLAAPLEGLLVISSSFKPFPISIFHYLGFSYFFFFVSLYFLPLVFNAVFGLRETLGMGEKMLNVTSSNFPPPNELLGLNVYM